MPDRKPDPELNKTLDDKLKTLCEALAEGEDSGPSTPFDFEFFLDRRKQASDNPIDTSA